MQKRIIACFFGDHTGFKKEFDCTTDVLKMSKKSLNSLNDFDYSSDDLVPEEIIEEARLIFTDMWGDGFKNVEFGFGVRVEESVCNYFGVNNINEIKP